MKRTIKRSVTLDESTMDQLERISAARHVNVSHLIREYIEKGLTADGYKQDKEYLGSVVREQMQLIFDETRIKDMMDRHTDRLAKMLMKIGKVGSGGFFLFLALIGYMEALSKDEVEIIYERSMKHGVQYMQLLDSNVNDALLDIANLSRLGL